MVNNQKFLGTQFMSILHNTSLVAQTVKRLPTVQETWVQSLGWEDLLQKHGPRDDHSK